MEPDQIAQVADRLFAAIVTNDIDVLRNELYAPDARIWHNTDDREQTVDENLRVLKWLVRNVSDLRYEKVRRHVIATGFVQQHVLRGTTQAGLELDIPACLVVTVSDGRISRIEEYIDSAALDGLRD